MSRGYLPWAPGDLHPSLGQIIVTWLFSMVMLSECLRFCEVTRLDSYVNQTLHLLRRS